jgi:hypothetical protein
MQYSADFVALGMHRADVRHAERELGLRRSAEERRGDDVGASPAAVVHRRHRSHHRAPRLAILR